MNNQQKIKSEQPEAFCLDDFIDEMQHYVKIELQKLNKSNVGVELHRYTHFKRCWVNIDRNKLRQIFVNLLSNSIRLTDRGYIFLGYHTSASGDNVNFLIDDTGIGIYSDSTLDLAISKGLVETMGGKMDLEITADLGIEIRFNIECVPFEFAEN